jgi:hypothetical protein
MLTVSLPRIFWKQKNVTSILMFLFENLHLIEPRSGMLTERRSQESSLALRPRERKKN